MDRGAVESHENQAGMVRRPEGRGSTSPVHILLDGQLDRVLYRGAGDLVIRGNSDSRRGLSSRSTIDSPSHRTGKRSAGGIWHGAGRLEDGEEARQQAPQGSPLVLARYPCDVVFSGSEIIQARSLPRPRQPNPSSLHASPPPNHPIKPTTHP